MPKSYRILLICLMSLLSACAHQTDNLDNIDTTNLNQLENVKVTIQHPSDSKVTLSQLRAKSLEDSAMSIGAQSGLAWASKGMNERMESDKKYLDSIFNFNAMLLTHGVLPPVLEEGSFSLNLADPNTIRVADKTYKIVQQARFVTTAPNWREYLILPYTKPALPDRTLLPRTPEEQKIWRKGIWVGWQNGIQQAYSIFQEDLSRLKRDYRGMMLYRKLLQERMINPPFVSRTELGVTGDGSDMRINDQVLRIVEQPKLQTNSSNWRAILVPANE